MLSSAQFDIRNAVGIVVSVNLIVNWPGSITNNSYEYNIYANSWNVAGFNVNGLDILSLLWCGSIFIPIGNFRLRYIPEWKTSMKSLGAYNTNNVIYNSFTSNTGTTHNSIIPAGAIAVTVQHSGQNEPITVSSGHVRINVVYVR